MRSVIVMILLVAIATSCHMDATVDTEADNNPIVEDTPALLPPREDITFILGEDKDGHNPYYTNSEKYYRYNDGEKTEKVITICHSLMEVQQYLQDYAHVNGQPWGLINIVSHGNPYLGMSAKVYPGGERATPENIREGIEEGWLQPLSTSVVDVDSRIVIHGCGLGDNIPLVDALKKAFIGDRSKTDIQVNRFFEYYISDKYHPNKVKQYQADYWMTRYKMGYRPSDGVLTHRFATAYPEASVDWEIALTREEGYAEGDVFHFTFDVPMKWVFPYENKDSIPDIKTKKSRLTFASHNETILNDIGKIDIAPDQFNWWMRKIYLRDEEGNTTPALWVKGYCTMLCVLKI